ncbi:hypothetical protein GCM10009789_07760 [Kribbella sancticallisti]|uniref:Secreted protein n=1 Tax=Kribbella sancticallisti TaxID=460087 RepID=A0ABN2CI97_9ACTN
MKPKTRAATTLAVGLTLAGTAIVPAHAASPEPVAPVRTTAAAAPGLFVTTGDKVHYSSTPPPAVSGHGWWLKGTTKATKAKVQIWIEVKVGSGWRVVAYGTKTVYPGGGSARRAAARMQCAAGPIGRDTKYTYRSRIDVDLIGHADSNEQAVTQALAFKCLPVSRLP